MCERERVCVRDRQTDRARESVSHIRACFEGFAPTALVSIPPAARLGHITSLHRGSAVRGRSAGSHSHTDHRQATLRGRHRTGADRVTSVVFGDACSEEKYADISHGGRGGFFDTHAKIMGEDSTNHSH